MRQAELAERTGLTPKHVNQIVKSSIGISSDVAVLLERALDVPARNWIRLESDFNAYESKRKARQKLNDYVGWAEEFDDETLWRHRIVDVGDKGVARVEKILKFFKVASPEAFEKIWLKPEVSFRRSQAFGVVEKNTALWLRLVQRAAEQVDVPPVRPRALRGALRTVPGLTTLTVLDGFPAAKRALAEAGVVLVFVREVPGTRVCGATTWLSKDRPVIGVTERHRKADILWFSIVHEIGHVLLHPRRTTFLDLDFDKDEKDDAEKEANEFAANALVDKGINAEIKMARSRQDLAFIAARLGVGTAIVAGRHAHLTNDWRTGASLRGKITDGDVAGLERM